MGASRRRRALGHCCGRDDRTPLRMESTLRRGLAEATPGSNQRLDGKQCYQSSDEDVETIHPKFVRRSETDFRVEVLDGEPDFDESFADWTQGKVFSVRGFGNFAESCLIQPAANRFPTVIAKQFCFALFVLHLDFLAGRRSDADGVHYYSFFTESLGGADAAFFEVFAIRQNHQELAAIVF